MQLIWIASLFFAVLIALFAVQNTIPVSVSFLLWRLEAVAVSALVLAAAAMGALLTYLFGLSRGIRSRIELRGNRSTLRDQERLIADLRIRVRELEREVELGTGAGRGPSEVVEAEPTSPPGIERPDESKPPIPRHPPSVPEPRRTTAEDT